MSSQRPRLRMGFHGHGAGVEGDFGGERLSDFFVRSV